MLPKTSVFFLQDHDFPTPHQAHSRLLKHLAYMDCGIEGVLIVLQPTTKAGHTALKAPHPTICLYRSTPQFWFTSTKMLQ
jgi:hypothetical protein